MIPPIGFGQKPTKGSGFGKIIINNDSLRAQVQQ